jgi:hypothetical protein
LEKKLLILYVCFLIVALVPASAIETSSIISQKTDNIKQDQINIVNEKNEIAQNTRQIDQHVNIIKDTIDGMNHVKWYQFWKWDFYIRQGPNRIQKESKIIESLSNNMGNTATNIDKNANSITNTGENSLKIGLDKANQMTEPNTVDNRYNIGNASSNAHIIAGELLSRFQKNCTVSERGTLQKGDIVQYPLSHENFVYLQYVGKNPSGDTALFLGDTNTAVRLPASSISDIQYKISSEASYENNKTKIPSENTFTSQLTSYIANIQKCGLKNYTDTNVNDYNNQIDDKKDTQNTGATLMIAGGVIGSVSLGMWIVLNILSYASFVIGAMAMVIPALWGVVGATVTTTGILGIIATSLGVVSAALLATGGGIYARAYSSLNGIKDNKNAFVNSNNDIENDLKTYNNGASDSLPVTQDINIDVEQNSKITSVLNATDADDDELTYKIVNQTSNGVLTLKNNGTYTYIPRNGFRGNDSFTFKANDVYGDSKTAIVHIIVHPVNHAPVSNNMLFDIETNNNLTAQMKATDPDADPLTYILINGTSNGNITVNSDGTFNYTPTSGFIGNDTFTYAAKDWKENGTTATVQIYVHPVNNLPVTGNLNLTVAKNENISSILQATDTDGDKLIYKLINKTKKGTVTLNTDGTFTYVPQKNMVGNETFTYRSCDWQGESNLGTVNIVVYEFNHPPIANNITIRTQLNHPFNGLFNVTDLDDDELTYKVVKKPVHGTLSLLSGRYIYTPTSGFTGNDGFTYQTNDGKNASNIATIKINVVKRLTDTGNSIVIINTPNKVSQIKNTLKTNIKITPYTPHTNQQNNQTINPQAANTTDLNTILEKKPINYLLTILNTTTNALNQIVQQINKIVIT